jgi:hypothetical protein
MAASSPRRAAAIARPIGHTPGKPQQQGIMQHGSGTGKAAPVSPSSAVVGGQTLLQPGDKQLESAGSNGIIGDGQFGGPGYGISCAQSQPPPPAQALPGYSTPLVQKVLSWSLLILMDAECSYTH